VSKTAEQQPKPQAIDAKITDEDIDRERRQIGISQYSHEGAHNRVASEDGIRNFAFGMVGDDNPLFREPDYGAQTRWRGMIAPPLFAVCTGINETPPYASEAEKALFRGLYRGVGRYNVGANWQLFRPIRPGDQLYHDMCTAEVRVKENSKFSGARTVIDKVQHLFVNADGDPVAVRYENFVNAERGGSKEKGKYADIKRQTYTPHDIAEIDKLYAEEKRRGAEPRWWEEVTVGDEIWPIVKGPLSTMDIVCAHLGWGVNHFAGYGNGPLRFMWKTRQKLAAFYSDDAYGVPAPMIRLHWDQDRAADLGLPAPYDYGQMRTQWAAHAVTNWMGDDAWISAFDTEIRMFNFHGDTTTLTGEVVDKGVDGPHHIVKLAVTGTNQRKEINVSANATVILPSRTNGPVVLPRPSDELLRRGARLMSEAADRKRTSAQLTGKGAQ
jgi:acyl dehydratase